MLLCGLDLESIVNQFAYRLKKMAQPQPPYVQVEPAELLFDVEGGRLDECKMRITNISPQRVGYKIFTHHVDTYLVQPKSGFVAKGETVEVSIRLIQIPDQPAAVDHVTGKILIFFPLVADFCN